MSYPVELIYEGSGFKQLGTAGATLPARMLVYLDTNGQWQLADADVDTAMPVLGITVGAISSGKTGWIHLWGFIGNTAWTWTAGNNIYASTVAGALTETRPVGAGDIVQPVGVALSSSLILFQGSVAGASSGSNTLEGSTAYVGFDQTKTGFVNYFYCDGTADDVQINEAQAYVVALGFGGGTIELEAGTYTITSPIIPTGDDLWFKGQGDATLIDGDGLSTSEHAFHVTGISHFHISDMSIQTEDGGGKTCHCIFIEDGSDDFHINDIHIIDSDSDGIHVEGTAIVGGNVSNCLVLDTDDNGIVFDMDGGADNATFIQIHNNLFSSAGVNGGLFSGFKDGSITENAFNGATDDGLEFLADCDDNYVTGNRFSNNGGYGFNIADNTSANNSVQVNQYIANTTAHILNNGDETQLTSRQFFVATDDDNLGAVPGKSITVGQVARIGFHMPPDVHQLTSVAIYVIPNATKASANWDLAADYGGSGEAYNTHNETEAAATYNVTDTLWFKIDALAAGLLASALSDDSGGISVTVGTAGDNVTVCFLELYYV